MSAPTRVHYQICSFRGATLDTIVEADKPKIHIYNILGKDNTNPDTTDTTKTIPTDYSWKHTINKTLT